MAVHKTGSQFFVPPGSTSTLLLTQAQLLVYPVRFDRKVTLDRVGVEITTSGSAGSTVRLGIWSDTKADTFGFYPYDLVVDLGTIDGTQAAGFYSITPSSTLSLDAGLYWFGACQQSAPATTTTLRSITSNAIVDMFVPQGSTAVVATNPVALAQASVTGAFSTSSPSFTTTVTVAGAAPRIHFRVV